MFSTSFPTRGTSIILEPLIEKCQEILGVLFVDGMNVNLEMVRVGLAEVYEGRPPRGFDPAPYLVAEKEAREAQMGMWVQGDKCVSPREWRRM
jgi:micrococcal nuclease